MPYANLAAVARKLMMMTADLNPPAYHSLGAATAVVQQVLEAVFLPLDHLDSGPREHAFWSVCAALIAQTRQERLRHADAVQRTAGQIAPGEEVVPPALLQREDLVRLYRFFLEKQEGRANAEEAAVLEALGVPGVLLFKPSDKGTT
jgi:hypothetical protein